MLGTSDGSLSLLPTTGIGRAAGVVVSVDCETLYIAGYTDMEIPAVFRVPVGGGATEVIYEGEPLRSPTGMHVDVNGVSWVMDHAARNDSGEGLLFAITGDGELSEVVQGTGRGTPAEHSLGPAPAPRLQAQIQPTAAEETQGRAAACVLDTLPPKPAQPRPVVTETDQTASAVPLPAAPPPAAPALAASPPAASASALAPAPSAASVSPGALPSAVSGSSAALPHCAPGSMAPRSAALAGTLQAGASSTRVFAAPCIQPPQRTPLAEEQQSLVRAPKPAFLPQRAQGSPGPALLMMWRLRCLLARGIWAEMKRRIISLPDHTLHLALSSRDTFLSWLQWIAEPAQLLSMRR